MMVGVGAFSSRFRGLELVASKSRVIVPGEHHQYPGKVRRGITQAVGRIQSSFTTRKVNRINDEC
jgi:hypothetical protein